MAIRGHQLTDGSARWSSGRGAAWGPSARSQSLSVSLDTGAQREDL